MGGESSGEAGREPVEEGSHPDCAPGPLLQPCCLASINIYSLPKTAQDFFFTFWKSENNETYQSKLIVGAPASHSQTEILLVWNVDLVIGWSSATL